MATATTTILNIITPVLLTAVSLTLLTIKNKKEQKQPALQPVPIKKDS